MRRFVPLLLLASCLVYAQDKPTSKSDGHFEIIPQTSLEMYSIVINGDHGDFLVRIHTDGKIDYGKDYKPDEAAKVFWTALGSKAPCAK
jgi:hypothetical protein